MGTEHHVNNTDETALFTSALPHELDSIYHEVWACGHCGREFLDCTSCVAHEDQCGGLTRC